MNRVDEALKRAREVTAAPTPAADWRRELPLGDRDAPGLDLYPPERTRRLAVTAERPAIPGRGISQAPSRASAQQSRRAYDGKLVIEAGVPAASIEQYRRLAAAVHHLQREQGLNRLMVSSSVPKEGKSLTVANLALTLSESYRRKVLLIDADLRRPTIHQMFGIENNGGLCEVLQSETTKIHFTQVTPQLSVLPAGLAANGNPMAALASGRMVRLLDELTPAFDWILLDAPPVALIADAGLLVRLTRAVILVIAAGATPYTVVEKVVAELGREHIVGTVLNRVADEAVDWSPYYSGPYAGSQA